MDYSNKTRDELISICKTHGLKGYSGKNKTELKTLLSGVTNIIEEPTAKACATAKASARLRPRYIDLFSGLGAFHTAFKTKFDCVLACDINEGARKIYKANYGLEPFGDIRALDIHAIPDFEILCAGFPCQPFSIAGNGEGFKDKVKGNLFYDILKIIDAKNPPMCILENVKNLKTHDNGNTYKTIEKELVSRGYVITSKVINSAEYGSPQARQRIFIVATKGRGGFVIPAAVANSCAVASIIDKSVDREDLDRTKYTINEVKSNRAAVKGKPSILYNLYPKVKGDKKVALDLAKAALEKKGGNPTTLDKGGRQGERVYSIDAVGITVCASSGGPGAKTGLYKVGEKIRRLTVKETLAMFGFPDSYVFPDISSEDALFYLGNSIVVNVPLALVPAIEAWFSSD
jgi:DNA (cytosine-5)-methyltransferase 1